MNSQKAYQEQFFAFLTKRVGSDAVLHETMEVLGLRKGAVYKRMNGDTALTTAELATLAKHFKVSLDASLGDDNFISFIHPFSSSTSGLDFLDTFNMFLIPLGSPGESRLTYLANELPVFYYFSHEYIFNFLMAIWNHLHWQDTRLVINKNTVIDERIQSFRKEITNYYNAHPVTEIWNSNMFANLYQQIIFSITIRAFEDVAFIDNLVRDINKLINHLKDLALTGEKNTLTGKPNTKLKIYLNEFGNYLNMVLYESPKFKATFIGFDIPQYMVSHNENIFEYTNGWINKIVNRSVMISSEGFQYRELFFIKMENDFKLFKDRVEKLVSVYYI